MPGPEVARVGDSRPVRVVFVGPTAAAHAAASQNAAAGGRRRPDAGPRRGPGAVRHAPGAEPDRGRVELPLDPAAVPGAAPLVRVALTGPLILNARDGAGDRRHLIERPTFTDLIRAGLRVLGPLHRCYGSALPDAAFAAAKRLAELVLALRAEFRIVGQTKSSHRSGDRWEVRGIAGWGEYGPVPLGLLPWLRWAGRLHVGTHRVAGAGGWCVEA